MIEPTFKPLKQATRHIFAGKTTAVKGRVEIFCISDIGCLDELIYKKLVDSCNDHGIDYPDRIKTEIVIFDLENKRVC